MAGAQPTVEKIQRLALLTVFVVIASVSTLAVASAKDYNQLGRNGFAHWSCASYGFLSADKSDHETAGKLFVSGHNMLSELVADMVSGIVKESDIKDVPIGVRWWLTAGPSVEFRMGYMWSQFEKEAYDKTWPDLKGSSFDDQKGIQKMSAQNEFQKANCVLLK